MHPMSTSLGASYLPDHLALREGIEKNPKSLHVMLRAHVVLLILSSNPLIRYI